MHRHAALVVTLLFFAACTSTQPDVVQLKTTKQGLQICSGADTVPGIDVSEWQGSIDWNAVAAGGFKYAITRINDGHHMDPTFRTNWDSIKAVGMIRGAYQFYEPNIDPTTQAQWVINAVGQLGPGDLPVTLDVEWTSGTPNAADIYSWMLQVAAGTGKVPMIYTAVGYWNQYFSNEFSNLDLWVANYGVNCPNMPSSWDHWLFWQWGGGPVPGIAGNVDQNVFNGNLQDLMNVAGQTSGSGCTGGQQAACGRFGCGCAEGQCSGGFCPGTGCSQTQRDACGAFGCGCVDQRCNGGFCPGPGCTAKETRDCGMFGAGCVDHQCNGGTAPGSGCTAKETRDCGMFGVGCVDHQCNGAYGPGTGCTARETSDCQAQGCGCADHACGGGSCAGTGCTPHETLECQQRGQACSLHGCVDPSAVTEMDAGVPEEPPVMSSDAGVQVEDAGVLPPGMMEPPPVMVVDAGVDSPMVQGGCSTGLGAPTLLLVLALAVFRRR